MIHTNGWHEVHEVWWWLYRHGWPGGMIHRSGWHDGMIPDLVWKWVGVCGWGFKMYLPSETTWLEKKAIQSETSSVKTEPNVKLLMSYPTIASLFHFKNWNIYSNREMLFCLTSFIPYLYLFSRKIISIFITGTRRIICMYSMRCKTKKAYLGLNKYFNFWSEMKNSCTST